MLAQTYGAGSGGALYVEGAVAEVLLLSEDGTTRTLTGSRLLP